MLSLDAMPVGTGKTGRRLASEHDGMVPDIRVLGKALGGMLRIAVTQG